MRIAFYAPLNAPIDGPPSGDRKVGMLLVRALERAGHDVELASTFRSFDGSAEPARQERLRAEAAAVARGLTERWRRGAAEERPQLWFTYHLYYKAPDWLGPPVSRALEIPYVVAEASHAEKRAAGPWASGHRACEAAIRQASLVLCPSRDDIAGVASLLGSRERIAHLPPFLDTGLLSAARHGREAHRARIAKALGADAGSAWLLAVAMMRPGDKLASYRALAQALARILDLPWTLLVAGDGPARGEVTSALAAAIPGRALFLGELGESALAELYAACDLLVWPAVNEAYGMALLEAQAAGLPVVAAKVRGVPEVVEDGRTGWLAPEGDVAALAAGVRALLGAPERRAAMGREAADFVARERGLDAAAHRLAALLGFQARDRDRPGT